VVTLVNVLKIKYDINCTIQGIKNNRARIYILGESMLKLRTLIKPYIFYPMLCFVFFKLNIN